MEDNIFDISFDYNGLHYKGWANPSEKTNDDGVPVSFHVVLNDISFGHLSFSQGKWIVNEDRPDELVQIVGKHIENHVTKTYQG